MNKLKSIIAIIAITLATTFSTAASEKKPTKISKELRSEIVSLLGKTIDLEFKEDGKANISFIVNNKNELIIVSVDSNLEAFNSIVKKKLNYKKINVKGLKKGEIYQLPVKINAK